MSYGVLLSKLEQYGVTGIVLDWFRSYLNDRRRRILLSKPLFSVRFEAEGSVEFLKILSWASHC